MTLRISSHINQIFNFVFRTRSTLYETDTSIRRTLILVPMVSVLERVDCTQKWTNQRISKIYFQNLRLCFIQSERNFENQAKFFCSIVDQKSDVSFGRPDRNMPQPNQPFSMEYLIDSVFSRKPEDWGGGGGECFMCFQMVIEAFVH